MSMSTAHDTSHCRFLCWGASGLSPTHMASRAYGSEGVPAPKGVKKEKRKLHAAPFPSFKSPNTKFCAPKKASAPQSILSFSQARLAYQYLPLLPCSRSKRAFHQSIASSLQGFPLLCLCLGLGKSPIKGHASSRDSPMLPWVFLVTPPSHKSLARNQYNKNHHKSM